MQHQLHQPLLDTDLFTTERGATAVEYSLLVVFIAVVIFASVLALGPIVGDLFQAVQWW